MHHVQSTCTWSNAKNRFLSSVSKLVDHICLEVKNGSKSCWGLCVCIQRTEFLNAWGVLEFSQIPECRLIIWNLWFYFDTPQLPGTRPLWFGAAVPQSKSSYFHACRPIHIIHVSMQIPTVLFCWSLFVTCCTSTVHAHWSLLGPVSLGARRS